MRKKLREFISDAVFSLNMVNDFLIICRSLERLGFLREVPAKVFLQAFAYILVILMSEILEERVVFNLAAFFRAHLLYCLEHLFICINVPDILKLWECFMQVEIFHVLVELSRYLVFFTCRFLLILLSCVVGSIAMLRPKHVLTPGIHSESMQVILLTFKE